MYTYIYIYIYMYIHTYVPHRHALLRPAIKKEQNHLDRVLLQRTVTGADPVCQRQERRVAGPDVLRRGPVRRKESKQGWNTNCRREVGYLSMSGLSYLKPFASCCEAMCRSRHPTARAPSGSQVCVHGGGAVAFVPVLAGAHASRGGGKRESGVRGFVLDASPIKNWLGVSYILRRSRAGGFRGKDTNLVKESGSAHT